jgi:hypothetical protein
MEDEQYYFWLGADADGWGGGRPLSAEEKEEEFLRNQHEDEYRSAK